MEIQYLAHHGILGQKWGVRRYQNEDGSLTEAGKKRKRLGNSIVRNAGVRNSKALKEARREDINELTTKQLKDYNERLTAENSFIGLTKGATGKGKDWANAALKQVVTSVVTGAAIAAGQAFLKKVSKSG